MLEGAQDCVPTMVSEASKYYLGFDPFLNSPPSMGTIMENQISGGSKKEKDIQRKDIQKKKTFKERYSKKNNKRKK